MTESRATPVKVLTLRLPQADADRVEFIARVGERSVNDVIRHALENYLAVLRTDEDFVNKAKSLLARDNEIASELV